MLFLAVKDEIRLADDFADDPLRFARDTIEQAGIGLGFRAIIAPRFGACTRLISVGDRWRSRRAAIWTRRLAPGLGRHCEEES